MRIVVLLLALIGPARALAQPTLETIPNVVETAAVDQGEIERIRAPLTEEFTQRVLTPLIRATLESEKVKNWLQSSLSLYETQRASSGESREATMPNVRFRRDSLNLKSVRGTLIFGVDLLRVSFPEGVTGGLSFTPDEHMTVAMYGGGTGLTVSFSLQAKLHLTPRRTCSPTFSVQLSSIEFTSFGDEVASPYLVEWFGRRAMHVHMAGKRIDALAAMVGVDCVTSEGLHFALEGGMAFQVGKTHGEPTEDHDIQLEGLRGPTLAFTWGWRTNLGDGGL